MALDINDEGVQKIIQRTSQFTNIDPRHVYIKSVEGSEIALGFIFFLLREYTYEPMFKIGRIFKSRTINFSFDYVHELITTAYEEVTTNENTNRFFNETMQEVIGEDYQLIPVGMEDFTLSTGKINEIIEENMDDHSIDEIQKVIKLDLNISIERDCIEKRLKTIISNIKHGGK